MTLIERLKSRAWEHRQHRQLREEAARRIADLEAEKASMIDALLMIARYDSGDFLVPEPDRLQSCCAIAKTELALYGVTP